MDGSTAPGFHEMWPTTGDCHYGNGHHVHQQQHLQTQHSSNFNEQAVPCDGGYQGQVTSVGQDAAPYNGSSLGALLSDAIGKITPQVEVALEELLRYSGPRCSYLFVIWLTFLASAPGSSRDRPRDWGRPVRAASAIHTPQRPRPLPTRREGRRALPPTRPAESPALARWSTARKMQSEKRRPDRKRQSYRKCVSYFDMGC